MEGVYLVHFDRPYKHAGHYLGWSENIRERLIAHEHGTGARLMEVIRANEISFKIARVWPGESRRFERRLKKLGSGKRLCPICTPTAGIGMGRNPIIDAPRHKPIPTKISSLARAPKRRSCKICHRQLVSVQSKFYRHLPDRNLISLLENY